MVTKDYTRDNLLSPFSLKTLKDRYLLPHETSPQDAFARAAMAFASNNSHAQRIYDYVSKLWFMYSTPILANGGTGRGMPISCFLNYTPDSRSGLCDHYRENAFLSSMGGGIGGFWGHVRSNGTATKGGSRSSGSIPFLKVVDAEVRAFAQGVTRRASYAAYMDISHPEIKEFLEMRKPTGGDPDRKCLNLHHGINIPDAFMKKVEDLSRGITLEGTAPDDSWELIDPHSKKVIEVVSVKALWMQILQLRVETGEPYLHFIDRSNEFLPQYMKDKGLKIRHSNLCSEITLPTSEDRTAVCCLSSVNLEKFDEWKDNKEFIQDIVEFLDNVLEYFISYSGEEVKKAVYSAKRERSLGLGAMGFHSYLQSKGIPFESALAVSRNHQIFGQIKRQAEEATAYLAQARGNAPDVGCPHEWEYLGTHPHTGEEYYKCKYCREVSNIPTEGTSLRIRNTHLLAIAPNASSSIICGETSPSIEPFRANFYTHKTESGSFSVKNKHLEKLLDSLGKNTQEVWSSIIANGGSVQHLDFLDEFQKDVFKTALEIDQRWIVDHAGDRQKFICQSQSVNLFFPANIDIPTLHHVHLRAWKKGLKSLYYLRSESLKRAEIVSTKIERNKLNDYETCLSCEG